MNIAVFSDVTPCGPIEIYWDLKETLPRCSVSNANMKVPGKGSSYLCGLYTSYSCSLMTKSNDPFLSATSTSTGSLLGIKLKNSVVAMCVAVNTQTLLPAEFVGITVVVCLIFHLLVCGVSVFAAIIPKAKMHTPFSGRVILNSRNYNYVLQPFCSHNISVYIYIYIYIYR
jgi:hypothetical protein